MQSVNRYSATAERLFEEIKKISTDEDFVSFIFSCAVNEQDQHILLDLIKNNESIDKSSIILAAFKMAEERGLLE